MSTTDPPRNASTTAIQHRIHPDTLVKIGYSDNHGSKDETCDPRFVVGYWSMRGLGAPVRMLLSAARVCHWVALYDVVEDKADVPPGEASKGGWSRTSWMADKMWMSQECNPFINLPYLVDVQKQIVLVQSNAILSYLGRELGMMGSSWSSKPTSTRLSTTILARSDELLCEIYDLRDVMVNFAYYGKPNAEQCWSQAENKFQDLEAYLTGLTTSSAGQFLMGDHVSAPDFHLYELLDQFEIMAQQFPNLTSDFLGPYPKLAAFKKAMENQPEHHHYLSCFLHNALPLNNPYAKFGSALGGKSYERGQTDTPWRNRGVVELIRIAPGRKRPFFTVDN